MKDTVPSDLNHPKLPSLCGQILVENNAARMINGHEATHGYLGTACSIQKIKRPFQKKNLFYESAITTLDVLKTKKTKQNKQWHYIRSDGINLFVLLLF